MAKKKKHPKKHAKKHHPKKGAKRSHAKKPKKRGKKHHERRACVFCGHRSAHGKAGCMHVSGNKICPCKG